jgi:hypothetical protein
MSYSVYFFAMDANRLAGQFTAERRSLLDRTEHRIREENQFAEEDIQSTMVNAASICEGRLPEDCDPEYFYALCWLAEVASEKVNIGSFLGLRHLSFLEETSIWPWMSRHPAPFPVPHNDESCPAVGFFPMADMEAFLALPESVRLPPSEDRDVLNARDEFCDVLETLIRDRLDLLAVLLYGGP